MATEGIPIILIRDQCSMDDLPGIEVAEGILTMRGGISNDVVDLVREMDKTAIIGGGYFGMKVDETEECVRNSENQICIQKRQMITLDGNSGRIHEGETPLIRTADKFNLMGIDEFLRVIQWANTYRNRDIALSINVVDPEKKTDSIKFHPRRAIYNTSDMFSNKPCHDLMQKYLLNESRGATNYLRLLEEFHRQDWMKIFKSSGGENFTIKLHDSSMNLYFELEEAEKNCQIYSSLVIDIIGKLQNLGRIPIKMECTQRRSSISRNQRLQKWYFSKRLRNHANPGNSICFNFLQNNSRSFTY